MRHGEEPRLQICFISFPPGDSDVLRKTKDDFDLKDPLGSIRTGERAWLVKPMEVLLSTEMTLKEKSGAGVLDTQLPGSVSPAQSFMPSFFLVRLSAPWTHSEATEFIHFFVEGFSTMFELLDSWLSMSMFPHLTFPSFACFSSGDWGSLVVGRFRYSIHVVF